jgi:hypothetical protein
MPSHGAEVTDLIKKVRASVDPTDPGKGKFKVAKSGSKHYKVLHANGAVVTDENGPLIISSSPSDWRWRSMAVARFMRAGVLKSDPYTATRGRAGEDDAEEDDGLTERERAERRQKEERARQLADRSETFRARTQTLRARVEPIVAKLGGWSRGGSGVKVSDFVSVLQHWANTEAAKLIPTGTLGEAVPASSWTGAVNNLRTPGGTVSEKWMPLLEGFTTRLERDAGEPPIPDESALIYLDLLRESKGIVLPGAPGDAIVPDVPEPIEVAAVTKFVFPKLAMDALFWMARGAGPGDQSEILALAEEIATLEATDEEGE